MKQAVVSWIILDSLWRILLIKRKYDKKDLPNYWSFPGGKVDPGEAVEDAVIREFMEEVGLQFTITSLYYQDEGDNNIFYRFLGIAYGDVVLQYEECDGYGWFHYDELKQLLLYSKIQNVLDSLKQDNILM